MKTIILLSLIFTISACNVSKKKETKECTINGVPRDFSECDRTRNPVVVSEKTRASINFAIELNSEDNYMDILDNYYDVSYTDSGRECAVDVSSGVRFDLRISGQRLILKDGSKSLTYERYGTPKNGFLGGWYRKTVSASGSSVEEFLTLHDSKTASLSRICYFK